MTIGLDTAGRRWECDFVTRTGEIFPGTLIPVQDRAVPSYDFSETRLLIRVRTDCPAGPCDIITDIVGRDYIVALHDTAIGHGMVLTKTYRLYPVNKVVRWERERSVTDTLTGLPRGTGRRLVAEIPVLIEPSGRERPDNVIKVAEETKRVISGSELKLGDILDDMRVVRVDRLQGVYLGELK